MLACTTRCFAFAIAFLLGVQAAAGTLDTADNLAQERLALRLLAAAPVRQSMQRLEQVYRADAQGKTEGGAAAVRRGVDSIALAAVQYALVEDGQRPLLMWACNAPHQWHGFDVPRSGYGIDNPDNVYRWVAIDGTSRYEITGRVRRPGPAQQTFILYGAIPGTTGMNNEGAPVVAVLRDDQMQIAADGSFVITIDPDPANGRPNHIQTNPTAKHMVLRDSLSDWATQNVTEIAIRRVGDPTPSAPRTGVELSRRAAELLDQIGPFWVAYDNQFVFSKPANQVTLPRARPGAFGFSSSGHYRLAEDEALVVTLDPLGAGYLGFQTTDAWGVAWEYAAQSSSLNHRQAMPNADGTITYVLARRDPGAANWLDVEGSANGMFAIRWQALPAAAPTVRAVRDARVVKLSELRQVLPAETRFLSAGERADWLRARLASYRRRLDS